MSVVVDDHLLIDLLSDTASGWLREAMSTSVIYTTGLAPASMRSEAWAWRRS